MLLTSSHFFKDIVSVKSENSDPSSDRYSFMSNLSVGFRLNELINLLIRVTHWFVAISCAIFQNPYTRTSAIQCLFYQFVLVEIDDTKSDFVIFIIKVITQNGNRSRYQTICMITALGLISYWSCHTNHPCCITCKPLTRPSIHNELIEEFVINIRDSVNVTTAIVCCDRAFLRQDISRPYHFISVHIHVFAVIFDFFKSQLYWLFLGCRLTNGFLLSFTCLYSLWSLYICLLGDYNSQKQK